MSTRTKFVLALTAVVSIAVMGVLSISPAADGGAASRSSRRVTSESPRQVDTGSRVRFGVDQLLDNERPISSEGLAAAVGRGLKLPPEGAVGRIRKKALLVDRAAARQSPSPAETGVGVLYEGGALLIVEPVTSESRRDIRSEWASPRRGGMQWKDGRSKAFDVDVINGRDTVVQRGGVQQDQHGDEYVVRPCVAWYDGGFEYTLLSDTLGADELEAVALTIK